MGRFVPGFQSGIGCESTIAEIYAVKCTFFNSGIIFPIRPRNTGWGHTLTVVELETSEEKAELSGYRKTILCCCWHEHWTAFGLVYNFKRNKGGDSPSARSLFWGSSLAAQTKMLCRAKKSKLKTLFAYWHIVYRTSQRNFIWLPSARVGVMWQPLCSPRGNQGTRAATDQSRSPALRTLLETPAHFHDAFCRHQNLGKFQSAPEPRLWQL